MEKAIFLEFLAQTSKLTSVLAQLQLMAVQRKRFISSMMRKRTPSTMVSHSSQCGRMPVASQIGDRVGRSDGSRTKTVVAARSSPSSAWPRARPPLTNDKDSPLHFSSSTHFPLHSMISHWI